MAAVVLLGAAAVPSQPAGIRGRSVEVLPEGRIVISELDPFGLDTESTAAAAPRPDAEILREAMEILPSLGCIGELAATHLAGQRELVRFGQVDIKDKNGELARGQVRPPDPGAAHLAIIVDGSKPHLHNPQNAARVIAHEFVHDLQFHAGMIRPEQGALTYLRDTHDPAAADEALQLFGQSLGRSQPCRIGEAARAGALLDQVNVLASGEAADLSAARSLLDKVIENGSLPAFQRCLEARRSVLDAQLRMLERGESKQIHKRLADVAAPRPSSRCHANVQALAMTLAADLFVKERWHDHAVKQYRNAIERSADPDLLAYAHGALAMELTSFYGYEHPEAWDQVVRALALPTSPDRKVHNLLQAATIAVHVGPRERALKLLDEASAVCLSRCPFRHEIEYYRRNWTPDERPVPKSLRKLQEDPEHAVFPP